MDKRVSGSVLWRQVLFALATLAVIVVFLFLFRSVLLPFVAGMALAYFLDPVADRLQKLGLSRLMATIVILTSFVVVFALSLMIIIPCWSPSSMISSAMCRAMSANCRR